jgi:hypothetical protein
MNMSNLEKRTTWMLIATLVIYGTLLRPRAAQRRSIPVRRRSAVSPDRGSGGDHRHRNPLAHRGPLAGVQPEPKDERDILIESRAYRNGYFAYGTGAFLVISMAIVAGLAHISVTPFLVVNLVLLSMVLAEVVKFGAQLLYYRKGA